MKKKYEVLAKTSVVLRAYIEAEDGDEAWKLANEMEWADFDRIEDSGDWNVTSVCEVKDDDR